MPGGPSEIVQDFNTNSVPASAANYNTATNAAVTVTYAASPGNSHTISGVILSYSSSPTGGNLQIQDGLNTILSVDVTISGLQGMCLSRPIKGTQGNALTLTLAAGGSGIVGRLSVLGHILE